jgi:hypothetical protein
MTSVMSCSPTSRSCDYISPAYRCHPSALRFSSIDIRSGSCSYDRPRPRFCRQTPIPRHCRNPCSTPLCLRHTLLQCQKGERSDHTCHGPSLPLEYERWACWVCEGALYKFQRMSVGGANWGCRRRYAACTFLSEQEWDRRQACNIAYLGT